MIDYRGWGFPPNSDVIGCLLKEGYQDASYGGTGSGRTDSQGTFYVSGTPGDYADYFYSDACSLNNDMYIRVEGTNHSRAMTSYYEPTQGAGYYPRACR